MFFTSIRVKKIQFCFLLITTVIFSFHAKARQFDLNNDNAALFIVAGTAVPLVREHVSSTAGDATLILRFGVLVTNAWFDSTAPYHPTAVGVYSHLDRRPESDATIRNMNIALLYASYHALNSFLPSQHATWRNMLINVGLDPDDNSTDLSTPIGIGNFAGQAVVKGRENDGMNQLGNEGGRKNNLMPYMDYTEYKPVNTAYKLKRPSRWQPDIQKKLLGLYKIQQFATPQYAYVEPYSYSSPEQFDIPRPYRSKYRNRYAYRQQAKEVLNSSANLTDEKKLKAEFFDDKFASLADSFAQVFFSQNLSLLDSIHLDFLINMAAFDAGIFVWNEKRQHDAVRPFSAIHKLFGNRSVKAWGGPGKGTIELPANEWKSYMEEADHPEYPSASTCFCHSHAQASRLFLGSDNMSYSTSFSAGSSRIEPGIVPAKDTSIQYDTWTDFAEDCGQSRVWAGVHFQAAVDESAAMCGVFGDNAYDYYQSLVNGTASIRPPSRGSFSSRKDQ